MPSVGLSYFFVCIFACLTKCFMTGLVSVYFMGVEGSLFTFMQSFYMTIYPRCLVTFYYLVRYVRVNF